MNPPGSPDPTDPHPLARPETLDGYEVLVCVCGGIAAYKSAHLVSLLVQSGAGVSVAMTRAARRFVSELTFRALSGRRVFTSLWEGVADNEISHLRRSEEADLIVVAPATANILGKLAGGIADELVSSLLLGAACPVMLAPAMNERMWAHPSVQRNVNMLSAAGVLMIGPAEGWQACRAVGVGRMAEPSEIHAAIASQLRRAPAKRSRTR